MNPKRSLLRPYVRHRGLLMLVVPCVLFFVVFHYVPMVGLIIAFKDFVMTEGILRSPWAGLENFRRLFASEDFPRALRNTLTISFLRLAFGFFTPIILALMLNELRLALFKRAIQTLTYLPYFFSWVILGGIFLMMFGGDGPVNSIIRAAGHSPVSFLADDVWFIVILIATGIWQGAGYGAVIYLAALSGIDPQLYEAATIDGANRWQQTLHVTLPCLVPTIVVLFILNLGYILNAGFDQIYNMYNPMVYDVADIIDTYVLRRLISMDFGLATAAGMFKSVVGLALVCSANWMARKLSGGEYGIW
jgi:putative aldouronate transport system permease protein